MQFFTFHQRIFFVRLVNTIGSTPIVSETKPEVYDRFQGYKNSNFGRFEVGFDRPEFDQTQQLSKILILFPVSLITQYEVNAG